MKILRYLLILFSSATLLAQVWVSDVAFLQALKNQYPTAINEDETIDTAKAKTMEGEFRANRAGIKSVEGLQFFSKLSRIELSENELTAIPDLSKFSGLTHLFLNKNQLTNIEGILSVSSLVHLDVSHNQLDRMGNMSKLINLEQLYATNNEMTVFPDLFQNSKLINLHLSNNRLRSVRGLQNLGSLRTIELSYNLFKDFPDLSSLSSIRDIFLNNNYLDTVLTSRFPVSANFRRLRIEKNELTISDLLKLTELEGFPSKFVYSPQLAFLRRVNLDFKTGQNDTLRPMLDRDIEQLVYRWQKDGINISFEKELVIQNFEKDDEGDYKLYVSHPDLLDLEILAFYAKVRVQDCFLPSSVSISSAHANCYTNSFLNVKVETDSPYLVEIRSSTQTLNSNLGYFENLREGTYFLKVIGENCFSVLQNPVEIKNIACDQVVISPNNDGSSDAYFFQEPGLLKIYDKNGSLLSKLECPTVWDGRVNGKILPVGYYIGVLNEQKKIGITLFY